MILPGESPWPVLFADRHLVVIDKPPGLAVSPGRQAGPSVEAATGWLLCHRLDAETSGCLVMARTEQAQRAINQDFADGKVAKRYRLWVVGDPPETGVVTLPIGEWRRGRVSVGKGKPAETAYKVIERRDGLSLVEASPRTGRTHQIRAHLSAISFPLVGDPTYGGPAAERLFLHAWEVGLPGIAVVRATLPEGWGPGLSTPRRP